MKRIWQLRNALTGLWGKLYVQVIDYKKYKEDSLQVKINDGKEGRGWQKHSELGKIVSLPSSAGSDAS